MTSALAALLTPQGKGAIASIGLRGNSTWDTLRDIFHPISGNPLPENPVVDRYWFGRLGEEMQDEAILAVLSGAPDWAMEIHVHGGREMTRYLLDLLERRGVATKTWEKHQPGASYLEILSRAATTRTAGMILDQMNGAFEAEIQAILEDLASGEMGKSSERMANLIRWIPLCRHLVHPYRIVVAGATNVGKSSLVNCMAGYHRAIVSEEAGTTRDAVATMITIDGWPVEVIDTAGLRETGELLEAAGIDLTWEELEQADLILWVLDASRPPVLPQRSRENLHLVINKVDLAPAWNLDDYSDSPRVSSRTGEGVETLLQSLSDWLVPQVPAPGTPLPVKEDHARKIEAASSHLASGEIEAARKILLRLKEEVMIGADPDFSL